MALSIEQSELIQTILHLLEKLGYNPEYYTQFDDHIELIVRYGNLLDIFINIFPLSSTDALLTAAYLPNPKTKDNTSWRKWKENIDARKSLGGAAIKLSENRETFFVQATCRITNRSEDAVNQLFYRIISIVDMFSCWEFDKAEAEKFGILTTLTLPTKPIDRHINRTKSHKK